MEEYYRFTYEVIFYNQMDTNENDKFAIVQPKELRSSALRQIKI